MPACVIWFEHRGVCEHRHRRTHAKQTYVNACTFHLKQQLRARQVPAGAGGHQRSADHLRVQLLLRAPPQRSSHRIRDAAQTRNQRYILQIIQRRSQIRKHNDRCAQRALAPPQSGRKTSNITTKLAATLKRSSCPPRFDDASLEPLGARSRSASPQVLNGSRWTTLCALAEGTPRAVSTYGTLLKKSNLLILRHFKYIIFAWTRDCRKAHECCLHQLVQEKQRAEQVLVQAQVRC